MGDVPSLGEQDPGGRDSHQRAFQDLSGQTPGTWAVGKSGIGEDGKPTFTVFGQAIAGEAGGVKFVVKPGNHTVIKPKADTTGRSFHAMFYFRKGNEAKPFFSSKWPISDKVRNLIFFYHDPETQRLRMHTIRDFTQDG